MTPLSRDPMGLCTPPRRSARRWMAALAAALIVASGIGLSGCGPATSQRAAVQTGAADRSAVGFKTDALFEEHYRKHGREFGSVSKSEYLAIAQRLRDAPLGGAVIEIMCRDGVVTRFDRNSGTFVAFNGRGVIRTCLRPRDGERYVRRQAERHGGPR